MSELYVVATPIGNLGDITFRAVETLKSVDAVYAEDTRQTRKLLQHYEIATPLASYHAHSSPHKVETVIKRLDAGDRLAIVTDAGTPAISDPGFRLVSAVRSAGHSVIPVPGPSAVTAALSAAEFSADQFTFLGFLPHKKGRQTLLDRVSKLMQPVVLYESPHRLVKLLTELASRYPEAEVCVARELTKKFEEFRTGTPGELEQWYGEHPPKGEIVVIISV